jgi:hypothetical protein
VCTTVVPEFALVPGSGDHRAACHLDEETKQREAATILSETLADSA